MSRHETTTQAERVAFINALREVVGRRCPQNKVGAAIVSDYDLVMSSDEEKAEARTMAAKAVAAEKVKEKLKGKSKPAEKLGEVVDEKWAGKWW